MAPEVHFYQPVGLINLCKLNGDFLNQVVIFLCCVKHIRCRRGAQSKCATHLLLIQQT